MDEDADARIACYFVTVDLDQDADPLTSVALLYQEPPPGSSGWIAPIPPAGSTDSIAVTFATTPNISLEDFERSLTTGSSFPPSASSSSPRKTTSLDQASYDFADATPTLVAPTWRYAEPVPTRTPVAVDFNPSPLCTELVPATLTMDSTMPPMASGNTDVYESPRGVKQLSPSKLASAGCIVV